MVADTPATWVFVRFEEMFTRWVAIESPDVETQLLVIDWIAERRTDPLQGMLRSPDFPNLWFGRVRHTLDSDRTMVTVTYEILTRTRVVRCLGIGRVGLPM